MYVCVCVCVCACMCVALRVYSAHTQLLIVRRPSYICQKGLSLQLVPLNYRLYTLPSSRRCLILLWRKSSGGLSHPLMMRYDATSSTYGLTSYLMGTCTLSLTVHSLGRISFFIHFLPCGILFEVLIYCSTVLSFFMF